MRRRVDRAQKGPYAPSGVERAGLPPGVVVRWFRNEGARVLVDGARTGERVPEGALVWADAPEAEVSAVEVAFPGAAAVVPGPSAPAGASTLPERAVGGRVLLTVREAVERALEAVPSGYREGAAREVEASLSEVGI